jgi:hypothetical protein
MIYIFAFIFIVDASNATTIAISTSVFNATSIATTYEVGQWVSSGAFLNLRHLLNRMRTGGASQFSLMWQLVNATAIRITMSASTTGYVAVGWRTDDDQVTSAGRQLVLVYVCSL